MITEKFRIFATSGVGPIEAGYGLVHADTIVATTEDELIVNPDTFAIELEVHGKKTSRFTKDLGLDAGSYDAALKIRNADSSESKKVKLLLVEPSRVVRRFGARYGSLEYDLPVVVGKNRAVPWASLWKTNEVADIVVDFNAPYKFILWRGMSFAPSWAMDNVMTSLFFAETVERGVYRDCCEMMSDRECRYIHARVIHSTAARVVIHWRYPLNDSAYTICRNQWVDEMFYIYPDGIAVRNVTIYIEPGDDAVWQVCPQTGRRVPCSMMINRPAGKRTFNDMEFITVNAPGATSDDNTPLEALSLLDGKDYLQTFCWPNPADFGKEPMPELSEYIFRLNYRYRAGVFVACPSAGLKVRLQRNQGLRYEAGIQVKDDRWVHVPDLPSKFADHIHWPVTRGYGTTPLTDRAVFQERPTHTFLGYANNAPVEVRNNGAVTWSWLSGIAPENEDELREKVRAWTSPAEIRGATYDRRQGAYIIDKKENEVVLQVDSGQDIIRPTFVLAGCESSEALVLINGTCLSESSVSLGIERSIDSVQTMITLSENIPSGTTVVIRTAKKDK